MHIRKSVRWLAVSCALALTGCAMGVGGEGVEVDGTSAAQSAPDMEPSPTITADGKVTLRGLADAFATVTVHARGRLVAEATADVDGHFAVDVDLDVDVRNIFHVSQKKNGHSSPSVSVEIVHDGTAPAAPVLDAMVDVTARDVLHVSGSAEAFARIVIEGGKEPVECFADDKGDFGIDIDLDVSVDADIDLAVWAFDEVGNKSNPARTTIRVDLDLELEAPVLVDLPDVTADVDVMVGGKAKANSEIRIHVGAKVFTGHTDDKGDFSIEVELDANVRNTLHVFCVDPTLEIASEATVAVVLHDSRSPGVAVLDILPDVTADATIRVGGFAEAGALVEIRGGLEVVTCRADDRGYFEAEVALHIDAMTDLDVRVIDAALNVSASVHAAIRHDVSLGVSISLDALPLVTADAEVVLSGKAHAGAVLKVEGGAEDEDCVADDDGNFSVRVRLLANVRNHLKVMLDGSLEVLAATSIRHDDKAPSRPLLDILPTLSGHRDVLVKGRAEANARIRIFGGVDDVDCYSDSDGFFEAWVRLHVDATTHLRVLALDLAGNVSLTAEASLGFALDVLDAPILDDLGISVTADAEIEITGRCANPKSNRQVFVQNEMDEEPMEESCTCDPITGRFVLRVELDANVENRLEIFTHDGFEASVAAVLRVTHDDIAPECPEVGLLDFALGGLLGCLGLDAGVDLRGLAGSVEAGARVIVENLDRVDVDAWATADLDGSFDVRIKACLGDRLHIKAVDAAGNVSTGLHLSVL